MSMFTNGVGRPSNETIRKRNIFKGICVLLVIVIIGLVAYILNDKGVFNNGNTKKSNETKSTTSKSIKKNSVDISKIKVENDKDGYFERLLYNNVEVDLNLYVPSKEDAMNFFEISDIKEFGEVALFNINYNDSSILAVMNSKGEIMNMFVGNGFITSYYKNKDIVTKLSGIEYGTFDKDANYDYYKINGNNITIYSSDLGQEICHICNKKDTDIVVFADTYEYKNDKFIRKDSEDIKSVKEYKKQYNITDSDCNSSCK